VRSSGQEQWLLVNASPDLPRQVELYLSPAAAEIRVSPLAGVLLTNADLDHALGLLQVREGASLEVVAPRGVRQTVADFLHFDAVLSSSCGVRWLDAAPDWRPSPLAGLTMQAIHLAGASPPRFHLRGTDDNGVGYLLRDDASGAVAGFFPDVALVNGHLLEKIRCCQIVFFDGTFWSEEELVRLGIGQRLASQMGHVPVSVSLEKLAPLVEAGIRIFFLHLNNTNPILRPKSEERRVLEAAGLRVAEDGQRFML
jgi:pyrroloquinoline quinone biosynthesis protein B